MIKLKRPMKSMQEPCQIRGKESLHSFCITKVTGVTIQRYTEQKYLYSELLLYYKFSSHTTLSTREKETAIPRRQIGQSYCSADEKMEGPLQGKTRRGSGCNRRGSGSKCSRKRRIRSCVSCRVG